jgi:hypothetical protein
MRTITITKNLYTFNELSEKAKEKVRQDYLSDEIRTEIFSEDCMNKITELFPNSDLKIQFSLCGCQGDGFNIYGEISFTDLMEILKDKFSEEEKKFLKWAFWETGINSFKMPYNNLYCYCIAHRHDFMEKVLDTLEYYGIRDIKEDVLEKMTREAKLYITKLCKDFEDTGYDFFYHVSDEEIEDWADANGYEFTEDGVIFY